MSRDRQNVLGVAYIAVAMSEEADVNALLDQARIPTAIKGASIALGAGGLLVALVGLQNLILVHWIGWFAVIPVALLAVGIAGIAVAASLVRARGWSLNAGLLVAGLLSLGCAGYFAVALFSGVFAWLTVMALGGAVTALVLVVLAVNPFKKLMVVRAELRYHGYDLNL
jgi:hypothetical protein